MTIDANRSALKIGEEITIGPKISQPVGKIEFIVTQTECFEELGRVVSTIDESNFKGCKLELALRAKNAGDCIIAVDIRMDGRSMGSAKYPFQITAG